MSSYSVALAETLLWNWRDGPCGKVMVVAFLLLWLLAFIVVGSLIRVVVGP